MGKKRIKTIDLSKEKPKKGLLRGGRKDSSEVSGRKIVRSGKQHGRIADMGAVMLEEMEERKEVEKEGLLRGGRKDSSEVSGKAKEQKREKVARPPKARSQRYQALRKLVKADKFYPLAEAIELLKKAANAKFDETVELHLVPSTHLKVGKVSWSKKKLAEKVQSLIKSTGSNKIKKAVLTSTMGPGIKINIHANTKKD